MPDPILSAMIDAARKRTEHDRREHDSALTARRMVRDLQTR